MLEFKFEFLQVVCNHEHYIPLNLPLDVRGKLTCVSLLSLYWWFLLNICNIFPSTPKGVKFGRMSLTLQLSRSRSTRLIARHSFSKLDWLNAMKALPSGGFVSDQFTQSWVIEEALQ